MRLLALALLCLASVAAHADLMRDARTGCQVEVAYPDAGEVTRWTGACKKGKADGAGVLTSSNGTYLEGEFREGRPFKATGRTVVRFKAGNRSLTNSSYQNGTGSMSFLDLPRTDHPTQASALVGRWAWTSNDGKCAETHEYAADGSAVISSADERMEKAYALLQVEGPPGMYALLSTSVRSNGKPDCQNNVSELHVSTYSYLAFDTDGSYFTCTSTQLSPSTCYGHAKPVGEDAQAREKITRSILTTTVTPTRTVEEIRQVMQKQAHPIYLKYSAALRKNPSLRGKLVLDLSIEASGKVSRCEIVSSTLDEPELEGAVVAIVQQVDFGAKDHVRTTSIRWPFEFLPQ